MEQGPYTKQYYENQEEGSLASAHVVVPIVMELVHPRSVIDIGCGVGTWLSVFKEQGVSDIRGFDGSWVKKEKLHIPADRFTQIDIESLRGIGHAGDLAISLEVGEHITQAAAPRLVAALTNAAPVVLFSAAIPHQGGTRHINEQWPAYWAELFREHGYVPVDCIRERVWNKPGIEFWYAQNTILYVDKKRITEYPALMKEADMDFPDPLSLVHPEKFLQVATFYDRWVAPVRALPYKLFPASFLRWVKRTLSKVTSRAA